jgi:hypothetical protein
VFLNLWIWEFSFFLFSLCCLLHCRLNSPGAVWCVLALQNARAVELMKVVWNFSWFLEVAGFARDVDE